MKVSVVIPTYNVEAYIEECLASVAAQTWSGELECIVVDDCGSDGSIVVAQRFIDAYGGAVRFSVLRRKNNGGLSAARNSGLRAATGDYVYFLDADDSVTPDCIERLVRVAEGYPGVDIVQGGIVNSDGKTNYDAAHNLTETTFRKMNADLYADLVFGRIPVSSWNKLIRHNLLTDNEIEFYEGCIHEDVDFLYKLVRCAKSFAVCNANTYVYRVCRKGSILNTTDDERSTAARILIYASCLNNVRAKYRRIGVRSVFVRMMFVIQSARFGGDLKRRFDALAHQVANAAEGLDRLLMRVYFLLPRRLQYKAYSVIRRRMIQ